MDRPLLSGTRLRIIFISLLLISTLPVVAPPLMVSDSRGEMGIITDRPTVGSLTVVTFDAAGPRRLVAYDRNSRQVYKNDTYYLYHDVDPSPRGRTTVMYVASELDVPNSACDGQDCILNIVERVNLTTGTSTKLYARADTRQGSSQIHDVDSVNESVLLIGDIGPPDRVYMVNIETGRIIWEWRVAEAYTPDSGGHYPGDWTHLNDVEYLDDGRVMVSLRNHDQVVFIEPGQGLLQNWTLGRDDDHSILYEHHNPDYIPRNRGGPAVLVADSENNRIVEYQRVNGTWSRSWLWRDAKLQWPRDADRLPNGNTLVVDSHGGRVLEVTPGGEIAWQMSIPDGGYDIERLGTGDESTGGPSMSTLEVNGTVETTPAKSKTPIARFRLATTSLVPSLVLHGVLFVLPMWVTPIGAVFVLFQVMILVCWLSMEVIVWYRQY